MFGYVLPEKPELKIKEYEMFRAYYCGVCKSIGKRYGNIPRLVLNYDSTFLALLLSSLADAKLTVKMERCIAHPAAKRHIIRNNEIIDYASDINILLAYYKLQDNWVDERSPLAAAGMLALRSSFKKLKSKYAKECDIIEGRLRELAQLEKEKCNSIDMAAEPFAKLMEDVVAYKPLCSDARYAQVLRWIGYNLGKWIYVIDAFDDIEKDINEKSYNPFIYQYQYAGDDIGAFKSRIKENVEFALTYTLSQISKGYELLDKKVNASIVENIIYMGMLRKTENILGIGSCSKVEKSV